MVLLVPVLELELDLPVVEVDVVSGGQVVGQVVGQLLLPVPLVVAELDVGGGSVVLPVDELPVMVVLPVECEVVFAHLDDVLELVRVVELYVDSGMLDDVMVPVVVL